MQILYDNKADTATLSRSTENSSYPVENIADPRVSRVFRTVNASGQYIKLSTRITASRVAIAGHNLTSGCTIKLQGNDTDSWATPALDETLTHADGIIIGKFAEATYNYWRLYVDCTDGSISYVQIGRLYLGTFLQLPDMAMDQVITDDTTSTVDISAGGQVYGDEGYVYRNPTVNFPAISDAERADIRAMWAVVQNVKPVFVSVWANREDKESPMYAILNQTAIEFKRTDYPLYPFSTTLKFREVF
jgi:hypothetical protein